jgi:hypothetical protein
MLNAIRALHFAAANQSVVSNTPFFVSPPSAGRKITAGFSFLQRIGKSASIDVWFLETLKRELDQRVRDGTQLGPKDFPAQWAAVRQFELLQESGNYKIYDMDATYLTRSLQDLTRNMRAGGYRVTVATVGSYVEENDEDELYILDRRLQDRISGLIHMLYLEEQSGQMNEKNDRLLAKKTWSYQTALPHVGVTLGARDLFRPIHGDAVRKATISLFVPMRGCLIMKGWVNDLGVTDTASGQTFSSVKSTPASEQYHVEHGTYCFAAADIGRDVTLCCNCRGGSGETLSPAEHKHKLARHFFDILSLLPQNHIVHDTAIGLQLPESIAENEWIYTAPGEETLGAFNHLLNDLFKPFDGISLGRLHERVQAESEIKTAAQHMRNHGDRLTPEADRFYRSLCQFAL